MFKMRCMLLCLLFTIGARAEDSDRSMAVSIAPLSLPFGAANMAFQYNLLSFLTLTVPAHFAYYWPIPKAIEYVSDRSGQKIETSRAPISVGGGLGARLYPTAKGMTDGFYIEPRMMMSYSQFGAENKEFGKFEWDSKTIDSMVRFGWDWFYDSGFYSTFGFGVGYSYSFGHNINVPSQDVQRYLKRLSYVLDFFPDPEARSKFIWDLEFKLGFAW